MVASLEDEEEHNAKRKTRMAKLGGFVRSRDFIRDLLVCCLSSIPRWVFSRGIQSVKREETNDICGSADDMARMIAETDNALPGRNVAAEYFWGREENDSFIRLRTSSSMMASLVYICDKNGEYIDPFWKIIRGEMNSSCVREYVAVRFPFSTIYICISGCTMMLSKFS